MQPETFSVISMSITNENQPYNNYIVHILQGDQIKHIFPMRSHSIDSILKDSYFLNAFSAVPGGTYKIYQFNSDEFLDYIDNIRKTTDSKVWLDKNTKKRKSEIKKMIKQKKIDKERVNHYFSKLQINRMPSSEGFL